MGNFSRDTFNKLNQYVGVRLQQGVPIVDADWNEMEDIRRYELEAFLKWFVGSGVPKGNDGFRIVPFPIIVLPPGPGPGPQPKPQPAIPPTNFLIVGGENSPDGIGRCLVEGWDVINPKTLAYTAQPLFNNQDLAKRWGVSPLSALTTPQNTDRTDIVYLDVWEREVNAQEQRDIVNEKIGIETCVRRKREWVVRVLEGTEGSATAPQWPSPPQGHVFYPLASLTRKAKDTAIDESEITDLRLTGLSVPSYHDIQQITTDAFGSGYSLDHDGRPNLKLSLRDAINALLRGELPGTPKLKLADNTIGNSTNVADGNGDVWVFWDAHNYQSGKNDIWYKKYAWANSIWINDTQLTNDGGDPRSVVDSNGDVWVFWLSSRSGNQDIWYKRYTLATSSWSNDTQLTKDAGTDSSHFVLAGNKGDIWVFWESTRSGNRDIWYKRYTRTTSAWSDDTRLTLDPGNDYSPVAVTDNKGDIWVFWRSERSGSTDIWYKRYTQTTSAWDNDTQLTKDAFSESMPFVLVDNSGNVWAFWSSNSSGNVDIWYTRYEQATATWTGNTQITKDSGEDSSPVALVDKEGDIWVFWVSPRDGAYRVWYKRYAWKTDSWGSETPMTVGGYQIRLHSVLVHKGGDIWIFWNRFVLETHFYELLCRTLIPAI